MEFGLFMMPLHPPRRSYADSYDRDLDLIVKADKLGYTEAWIGEHITERWENAPAPELLIAKASALTENIIFGAFLEILYDSWKNDGERIRPAQLGVFPFPPIGQGFLPAAPRHLRLPGPGRGR